MYQSVLEPPSFADHLTVFVFAMTIWLSFLFWLNQGVMRLRSGLPRRLSYAVIASFLMGFTVSVTVVFTETHDRISGIVESFWSLPIIVLFKAASDDYWGALAAWALALALVVFSIPRAQNPAQRLKSFAFAGFVGAALPWAVAYAEGRYFESKLVSEAQALGLRCIGMRDYLSVLKGYHKPDDPLFLAFFPPAYPRQALAFRNGQPWEWNDWTYSWVPVDRDREHKYKKHPCFRPASAQMGAAGGT